MGLYQRKTWPPAGKAHVFDQAIRAAPVLAVCFRGTNVTCGMAGGQRTEPAAASHTTWPCLGGAGLLCGSLTLTSKHIFAC